MVVDLMKRGVVVGALLVLLASMPARGGDSVKVPGDARSERHDLVIVNGRVIDPETGRDEVASVAIKDGIIQKISPDLGAEAIDAKQVIDASGQVVSPGFINTHTHEDIVVDVEQSLKPTSMLLAHDGVTLWLGGQCGMSPTGVSIVSDEGVTVTQGDHTRSLRQYLEEADKVPLYNHYAPMSGNLTLRSQMGLRHMENETPEQVERMKKILADDMKAGSFGISGGLMYDMGATTECFTELARVSKNHGGMAALHTRYPTFNLKHLSFGIENVILKRSIYEAIDVSRDTGVPMIVSHITAMAQADSARWNFEVIDRAIREEGLPLAGDIIGDDYISNDFYLLTFKGKIPVKVMQKLGNYDLDDFYAKHDVYVDGELFKPEFGQFTLEELEFLRKNVERIDGFGEGRYTVQLLCKVVPKEDSALGLQQPWVFVGNDHRGKSVDPETGEWVPDSHRALATFSRLMGHWARDYGAITLHQAIFKATIAPAMWMGLDQKGRLQEGCDADIVVFDPDVIIDRADWMYHKEALKPDGISYVIVGGEVVVDHNQLTGATPGKVVRRTWEVPGDSGAVISLHESRFNGGGR